MIKSNCNNIMADRLNKLCEYLRNEDYELAIKTHRTSRSISNLNEDEILKLAKAYFYIGNDYKQSIQILQKIKNSSYLEIIYQARLLFVKAVYFIGEINQQSSHLLNNLKQRIASEHRNNQYLLKYYLNCIKEVENIIFRKKKDNELSRTSYIDDQRKQFQRLLRQQDDNTIVMQGMPKFLISTKWYETWKDYTGKQKIQKQRRHPGPITQFDLLDYQYRIFIDPNPAKDYTNIYTFNGALYEILPKKCWTFLKQRYGGIDIKRFNISFIDKPYDIMTEVFLKKIQIAKQEKNQKTLFFIIAQITKKQAWSGLKSKLARVWGQGDILQFDEKRNNPPINEAEILEEVDTIGKRYIYVQPLKKKTEVNKNLQKCGNKNCSKTQQLKFCKCKSIKYCSMDCLKQNFKNHKKKCQLQQTHNKQQSVILKNFNLQEKDYGGMKGRVGLKNLGNTCYMNSGLQCLSNTKELTQYFMKDDFKNQINYSNNLGTKGNLSCTYAQLIRQIWTGANQSVSPFKLKKVIGNYATQFSGFGQQDSQQFISYLIDGLSEDLNLVKKKQTFETGDEIKPDQQMSRESESNYARRVQSYVRNLMVGQFKSTVVCLTCNKKAVCFDPYLLISLPIPTNQQWDFFFVPTDLSKGAVKFPIEYNRTTTLQKVTKQLVARYNKKLDSQRQSKNSQRVSPQNLLYIALDGDKFQIIKYFNGNQKISSIKGKYILFCLQIPQISPKEEQILIIQFLYKNQIISFPRFIKIPRKCTVNQKQAIICQALKRANNKNLPTFNEVVNGQKMHDDKPYKRITFECRNKMKLLTYTDARNDGISKFMESTDQVVLSLDDCLNSFSQEQNLVGENLWYCNRCKDHKEATRHLQIYKSNKILVIAFKRFNRFKKIRIPIKFPIQSFNMGPYLLSNQSKAPLLYDLYGVVNHYGTMGGGHYTAYCQNFLNKKWYQFNDSRVSEINRSEIISGDAYVLFFRRRD